MICTSTLLSLSDNKICLRDLIYLLIIFYLFIVTKKHYLGVSISFQNETKLPLLIKLEIKLIVENVPT